MIKKGIVMEYNTELTLTLKNTDYFHDEEFETEAGYGDLTVELLTTQSKESQRLEEIESKIEELDVSIDNLTNHADKLDYAVSIASGIICGVIDILFVGKFDLDEGIDWSSEKINDFVVKVAKSQGYPKDDLKGAIQFLEKFGSPCDKAMNVFGGGKQHHLRDFAHHASPIGLFFSLLTQFTQRAYGTDKTGSFITTKEVNPEFIGKDVPHKFLFGMIYWVFHMASDMAGSSGSAGGGTGVPGPIMSMVKLLSTIPIFKDKDGVNNLSVMVSKLFNGTLLAEREDGKIIRGEDGKAWIRRMDLRGELGVLYEVGKQSIPIIANEMFVRGFYFVNRLIGELKEKESIHDIEWKKTIPFNNRTIARMMTVSLGTFHAVDVLDAAIEGAIHCKGQWAEFGRQALLRLNFVGIGRFTIALGNEAVMGWKKYRRTKERMMLKNEALCLMQVKLYQSDVLLWEAVSDAERSVETLYDAMYSLVPRIEDDVRDMGESLADIADMDFSTIDEHNAGLTDELLDIL